MITNIEFDLDGYQKAFAYVAYDDDSTCHISGAKQWKKVRQTHGDDFFFRLVVATLSHETMHKVMECKLDEEEASTGMDNLRFDEGIIWELATF